jgi:hypothetical protein
VATAKPLVQVACVCEKVLREHDGVPSLIRIIDTYFIEPLPDGLPEGFKGTLPLTIFVALKSGEVTGEHTLAIRARKPDGTVGASREWPARFGGGESGVFLEIAFHLQEPEHGLHWFEVLWPDPDEVLARFPLRVQFRTTAASGESSETKQLARAAHSTP